jgi:RHS repeat-associated protein
VSFYYDGKYLDADDNPQTAPGSVKGKTTGVRSSVSRSNNIAFDSMGRLTASQQITDGEIYGFGYSYNLSGALIEETYPSGRVVRNTLNADGEMAQVESKKNASDFFRPYASHFSYNSAGAVTAMKLGNGRWETAEYNERLQITQIGLGSGPTSQNLLKLEFKYNTPNLIDNNGSMREQKITVPTVGTNAGFTAVQTYVYDSLNRIQSATENINGNPVPSWKQVFDIDRYGNRRFDAGNTTTIANCDASVCNPEINTSDNRLKKDQVGGTAVDYDYDANGALIKDFNGQRFGYDAESHQKEFFSASNQTTTPDATYHYDGEGRRIKKTVGSEVTVFVYDASGQLSAEYSTTVAPVQDAKISYLTTDHLGSPRIITDAIGAVISRKDFTAFGEEVTSTQRVGGTSGNGYDPPNVRQDYTGYQKDEESGLEFAQARYYNTGHGRFTSVDPLTASATIRNPQTFNRYSYALNSPYKFVDPLGLQSIGLTMCETGPCVPCPASVNQCTGGSIDNWAASATRAEQLFVNSNVFASGSTNESGDQPEATKPDTPPGTSGGDPAIVFNKVEVFDVLDDTPTASTTPPIHGDANTVTPVDLGYNPGASTFFVKVSISAENGQIVKSVNPERPDIFNTRVEANTSPDAESDSQRGKKLDLANFPGASPPINQKVDISDSGKTATITFAVKLSNDSLKMNTFTVTAYGVSKSLFGPNGKLNTESSFRGTLRIKFALPQSKPTLNPFLKNRPF